MELMKREDIRNIAIIAHVDHGKTTLVDALLKQSHVFRTNEKVQERVMDSNDLEKERGITILSKNTAVMHNGVKINIVDTPGHADFGGEVERVLKMVDSVLLVVDSYEGPMPQTKFVLKKALELGLKPIVVINKIDKPDARPEEVIDEVFELFIELGANDEQLDFPIIYASARNGFAKYAVEDENDNMQPLFETIIKHVSCPEGYMDEPFQMLVTTLDSNAFVGKIAIGKIHRGKVKKNQNVTLISNDGSTKNFKVTNLFTYNGLKREETEEAGFGDIVALSGVTEANIGDTIADSTAPEALPFVHIDEPTLSMNFMVNTSPFAGRSGKYVTSRNLKERLERELEVNVGLRVEATDSTDTFKVSGRGELGLTILIENMRREGYELAISKPQVIYKYIDGKRYEPIEKVICEVPVQYEGTTISKLNLRNGEMLDMVERNNYATITFKVATRALIGFRSDFINFTRGEGILIRSYEGYEPYQGEINTRSNGVMVSNATGTAMKYSIFNLQERGSFFIGPQTEVYEGMIVGVCSRDMDMPVNPTKNKTMTAVRSTGHDDAMLLTPPIQLTLEYALEFISDDELVEVTPDAIRLRKKWLTDLERKNAFREKKKMAENN